MEEVERVSELIGSIYDASLDRALWPSVFDSISGYMAAKVATLGWQDVVRKIVDVYFSSGIPDDYMELYRHDYFKLNPVFPSVIFFNVEETHWVPDVLPREEFCRTRFFREWLLPQGLMDGLFATVDKSATGCALFLVMRHMTDGLVDEVMRRRFALIVPHVRRALLIGNVIDRHRVEAAALADTLDGLAAGVFLVDAGGRIVHANASGHALVHDGSCLSAPGGRLTATDPQAGEALRDAFVAAAGGDNSLGVKGIAVPLKSQDGDRYIAHTLPLTAGARRKAGTAYAAVAAVFVRKTELDLVSPFEAIARDFRLTPAEVRVLFTLVDVGGVPEAAPVLGISETTVKTHLKHLFEKTATSRQADLVKLVAGYTSPLTSAPAPGSHLIR